MRHGAPWVVFGWRLWEPDVARVACKLAALERAHDRVTVADLSPRRVHDIAATLHHADQLVVEHAFSLWMERCVDGYHVADFDQRLDIGMEGEAELLLNLLRQAVLVSIVELHAEGLHPFEGGRADASGGHSANFIPLEIGGAHDESGVFPTASNHPAVGGDVVPDQRQDHHDDVLGDADRIAI